MFRNSLILFCFIFLNISLSGQNFTQNVRGKITDAQSGAEIPGVMVQLLEGDSSNVVLSDVFGNYKLQNVPIGRVDILFMMTGFDPVYRRNLIVASGKELILNVKLEESVNDIQVVEINVKSNQLKPNNKSAVNSTVNLNPQQTQKFAGTLMDVSRMAANYAGVVPSGDQRNDILYSTLKETASGSKMMNAFEASTDKHVYIKVGAIEKSGTEALTTSTSAKVPKSAVGKNIAGLQQDMSAFNGVEIQAEGEMSFVLLNEDLINNKAEFSDKKKFNAYEKAAVLFHEVKAHVELADKVNAKVDELIKNGDTRTRKEIIDEVSHSPDFYGSHGSGYRNGAAPGSPAEQIKKELEIIEDARKTKPAKKDNTNVGTGADSPG